jgi:hypothetical protein
VTVARFGRIAVTALSSLILPPLAAGFLATLLITLAPGFGVDERELDNRFSAEGIANIRRSVAPQRNVLISYFSYFKGLSHGDLGLSRTYDRSVVHLLNERSAVTGVNLAVGLSIGWAAGLLLFGALVVVPLGLALLADGEERGQVSVSRAGTVLFQAVAAVCLAASFFMSCFEQWMCRLLNGAHSRDLPRPHIISLPPAIASRRRGRTHATRSPSTSPAPNRIASGAMPPKSPPSAQFIDTSRVDALLADVVPDDEDRAFVVRCILSEGPAHHRGANYVLLLLLGMVVEGIGGADMPALGKHGTLPVPMKVPPHLARPGSFMAYPLGLPTAPLEKLAPNGSVEQSAMAQCLMDGPPQHALANAAMLWLIGAALDRLRDRGPAGDRPSARPRARPSSGPKR